ncbi:hypothetical protein [uncultured Sphaerochaeta sp.]|uniref:hypothetical protein n=1 Tax=uncultured Sphaerochaeta sp. TaxID=886478 RepID=UPI0029CA5DF2|nr:hypothetical protein [uncultured Sphaerochaeta sp.]
MKKALIPILLVLLLTLAFTSCDANIRQDIASLMGDFSENVYIANGFVEANTANAAAVTATTASIGTGDSAQTVTANTADTTFGVSVTVPTGVTKIIKPQTEAEQEETKDNLATAFASPKQTEELVESLKKPATDDQKTAAKGTVTLFNATLEQLKTDLGGSNTELADTIAELALPEIEEGEELTQGDVLVLQMMTNLISNTVATLNEASNDNLGSSIDISTPENKEKVLSIVDDALFTAQVAEQLSGAASIDFSGQLDLAALLSGMNDDSSQSVSRAEDDNEFGDVMVSFNNLIPDLLPVMGITVNGEDFTYTQSKYKSFLMNQKSYRGSIEHALRFARKSGLELSEVPNANFDTSTLIKYMLSVLITEHHAYWASEKITSPRPETIIAELLDDNPEIGLGTMPEGYEPVEPTITGFSYDGFEQFLHDGTTEKPRTYAYYEAIVLNLQALNSINGITQLDELLDDLLDDANTDNLQSMYDDWDSTSI